MNNKGANGIHQTVDEKANPALDVIRRDFYTLSQAKPELSTLADGPRGPIEQKRAATLRASSRVPRILMVEDNWDHAYLGLKALTAEGRYQVELVSSGAEALYKLTSGQFSLVLLDYCLSGMNGLSLIRKIKELGQDIPVVMITGLGSETVAVEAMKMGAYDYIVKSGNYLAALPLVIEKAIERYDLKKVKEQWDHWVLKRNRELGELHALSGAVHQLLDVQALIKAAVAKTVEILAADYGQIFLTEAIQPATTQGVAAGDAAGSRPNFSSIAQQVVESGEPLVIESISAEKTAEEPYEPTRGLQSTIYIPLRAKQGILGVLVVGSRKRLRYHPQEMMFYSALGHQIATAIENAQIHETIRRQAEQLREAETKYQALMEHAQKATQEIAEQTHLRELVVRSQR